MEPEDTAPELPKAATSFANADPNYRALRDGTPKEAIAVTKLTLKRDVGKIYIDSGVFTFLKPVLNRRAIAVFTGKGSFHLDPALLLETNYLESVTAKKAVDEDFDSAILAFSDNSYDEIKAAGSAVEPTQDSAKTFESTRQRLRRHNNSNLEAEVLTELYNPARGGLFFLLMHGNKHAELTFIVAPQGALSDISPEEVALLQPDPATEDAGIWYLTHRLEEWKKGAASSAESKRIVSPVHYAIDTTIDKHDHLHATCKVRLKAADNGDRVISFDLLSALRVSRVSLDDHEIQFIQEGRKRDGSFYVILPEPTVADREYALQIEYAGDKVIHNAGGGTYSVGARTSWYPSLNAFHDRAVYELTFRVPHQYTLVSVGKLEKDSKEDDYQVTQWNSEVPVLVAGFNYGFFKKKERPDEMKRYEVEAYATREMPDYMRAVDRAPGMEASTMRGDAHLGVSAMSPSALAQNAMVEATNALRVYELWFGPIPFHRLAITQQPEFNFGQSWPTLIYLPISAFLDSTQRWSLLGQNAFKFADFIQEVTPHEVSHQWWGHAVGWASYHDQWLSEGFADFSAALYLEQVEHKPDAAQHFWERAQRMVLEKNQYGRSANDAGPLWLGYRLNTFKNRGAYNRLVYPKGGYVLQMLRGLMWDANTGNKDFVAMMHDFVSSFTGKNATTEDFQRIVEKHMKPLMDLEGNGKMDWFFKEWVYRTDMPAYHLKYSLKPGDGGSTVLTGTLTQSGVSPDFKMRVPLFIDLDGKLIQFASARMTGSSSQELNIPLVKKPKRVLVNALHGVLASESVSEGN